jgi:hypothetical protein
MKMTIGRREKPEPSSDPHHPVLGWRATAEILGETHRHAEQPSKEEDPSQDAEKILVHTLLLFEFLATLSQRPRRVPTTAGIVVI